MFAFALDAIKVTVRAVADRLMGCRTATIAKKPIEAFILAVKRQPRAWTWQIRRIIAWC